MFYSVEFMRQLREQHQQGIAQIDAFIEGSQAIDTTQLTQALLQKRQVEVIVEAIELWLEKFDPSRAVDMEPAPGPTNLTETDTKE